MRKKDLDLRTQFREARSYIGESKIYIYSAIGVFIFAGIFGFIFEEALAPLINELLKDLIDKTAGLNTVEMIFFILQNNLQSAFVAIILGAALGIFPFVSNLLNGAVLGYVLARTFEFGGFVTWWRLLPHGIFELPAIFISFGLGMRLGFTFFIDKKKRTGEFKRRFFESMNAFLMVILPLLILAAIIEGILIGLIS